MDGHMSMSLSCFIATWAQIVMLYYKIGKLEEKVNELCRKIKPFRGRR